VIHGNPSTVIWRGEIFRATSALGRGDEITASGAVHHPDEQLTAEEIWANLTATEGVILKVLPDRIIVNQYPGADKHTAYPLGRAPAMLDAHTHYVDGAREDLKAVRRIRAVGSKSRNTALPGFWRRRSRFTNDLTLRPEQIPGIAV